jgi:hypothetical protein
MGAGRLWLLAVASASPDDTARGLAPLEPQQARDLFGNISSLRSIHKQAARAELLVSRTYPVSVPASCIQYRDDIRGSVPEGQAGNEGAVMSDGCGYISSDLARLVPRVCSGRVEGGELSRRMPLQVGSRGKGRME